MPRLFQNGPSKEELAALARQRAFARDRVLGKRPLDEVDLGNKGLKLKVPALEVESQVCQCMSFQCTLRGVVPAGCQLWRLGKEREASPATM